VTLGDKYGGDINNLSPKQLRELSDMMVELGIFLPGISPVLQHKYIASIMLRDIYQTGCLNEDEAIQWSAKSFFMMLESYFEHHLEE
jgi:hypothetical protein